MKIFLTGGAGRIGKSVVTHLIESGHTLRVFDRAAEADLPDVEYISGDILDYPRLRDLVRGFDAVVHLAAISAPGMGPNEAIFQVNTTGTFHIFQAAAAAGIGRVVQASSINAVGYYYGVKEMPLEYLPLDEAHPSHSTDAYSFSKHVVEEIGDYFWRREGISSAALRFPAVILPSARPLVEERRKLLYKVIERVQHMDAESRFVWLMEQRTAYNALRARRAFEDPDLRGLMWREDSPADAELRAAMGSRYNFFSMLDNRDAAQAVEKAVTASFTGAQTLFATDCINWTGLPTALLIDLFFPDVPHLKQSFTGHESLVSCERARDLIGFTSEFHLAERALEHIPPQSNLHPA